MDSTTRMTADGVTLAGTTGERPRTDTLSPEERSARMALVRSRDTKPELRVRGYLHASGLRYRLHRRVATARPDLVFPARRTVVFVHGCIWHRHPDPNCPLTRTPKSRVDFWTTKFAENVARDARQRTALEATGWRVLVIWECQTREPARLEALVQSIEDPAQEIVPVSSLAW